MTNLWSIIGGVFVVVAFVYLLVNIMHTNRHRKDSLRNSSKLTTIVVSIAAIFLGGSWISQSYPLFWYGDRFVFQTIDPSGKLENIKWSGRTLAYAHLSRANLRNADLSMADLWAADLSEADLNNAVLTRTLLEQANLQRANLSNANLRGARISQANLAGAILQGADLAGADLSFSYLRGTDLSGANLKNANLAGTDLRLVRNLSAEQLASAITNKDTLRPESTAKCVVASINTLGWLGDRKTDFCRTLGFDDSFSSPDAPYSEGGYCIKGPIDACEKRIRVLQSAK